MLTLEKNYSQYEWLAAEALSAAADGMLENAATPIHEDSTGHRHKRQATTSAAIVTQPRAIPSEHTMDYGLGNVLLALSMLTCCSFLFIIVILCNMKRLRAWRGRRDERHYRRRFVERRRQLNCPPTYDSSARTSPCPFELPPDYASRAASCLPTSSKQRRENATPNNELVPSWLSQSSRSSTNDGADSKQTSYAVGVISSVGTNVDANSRAEQSSCVDTGLGWSVSVDKPVTEERGNTLHTASDVPAFTEETAGQTVVPMQTTTDQVGADSSSKSYVENSQRTLSVASISA